MAPSKGNPSERPSPIVLRVIEQIVRGEATSAGRRAEAVAELSRLFTKGRQGLGRSYLDDPACCAAYLAYFLPVNLSKIQLLLDELPSEDITGREPHSYSVLDLGAGPGTGVLAVADWLRQQADGSGCELSAIAVDSSSEALRATESLWTAYWREVGMAGSRLRTCEGDIERLIRGPLGDQIRRHGPYDLIVLANCLNEIFSETSDPCNARAALIADLLPSLVEDGTIMVIEPAMRRTARDLHRVRDRLLQEGRCTIYSPCLHERPCPALVNPEDWCHEERAWEPPTSIQAVDEEVGFIKDALKFSYLLLRKDGRTIVQRDPQTFRIVSELRRLKGDSRAWVCNELGRSEVGRLDRARSPTNASWEECQRGTIVRIQGVTRRQGATLGRIPAESMVEIIRSA
jgi:ribosomal protein RSM22 (predicted rRNA methylase)